MRLTVSPGKTLVKLNTGSTIFLYVIFFLLFVIYNHEFLVYLPFGDPDHPLAQSDHDHVDDNLAHIDDTPHTHTQYISDHDIGSKKIISILLHGVLFLISLKLILHFIIGIR